MAQLRRDFTRFVEDTGDKTIPALLGAKFDGVWQLPIPGQRGVVWVTTGGTAGFAGNKGAATGYTGGLPGMPIRIKIRNGLGEIVGPDHDQLPTYTGGGTTLPGAVGPHTHGIGSGMVDPVEGLRVIPGTIGPYKEAGVFGLKVYIKPFGYHYAGQVRWWGGAAIDLTAYRPGTSNTQAWVIVGIDPATKTAVAQTGTEYGASASMTPSLLDQTAFAYLARGAVKLSNGQTAINNMLDFVDLRSHGDRESTDFVNAIGSIGGGTQDIDLNLGSVVTATVDTSETTFTFSNPPVSGVSGNFTLILTNGGSQTVNWPGAVQWAGGTGPSLTSSGVDVLTFFTVDGGTTWYGFTSGLNFS